MRNSKGEKLRKTQTVVWNFWIRTQLSEIVRE